MLIVSCIAKTYPTHHEPLCVLTDISFQVSAGESVAIVGPSGSGKSTLLYILGTLEQPTSGHVTLNGRDPFSLLGESLAAFRNQQIGFVFQDHHLLPQLSVFDNVRLGALAAGSVTAEVSDRALMLIERVGLAERRRHLPSELSGGERQRAAIARALLLEPELLLADEPTGNLDRENAIAVTDLLLEMQSLDDRAESPMLIVVTHSSEVASRMGRQLALSSGRLVEESRAGS